MLRRLVLTFTVLAAIAAIGAVAAPAHAEPVAPVSPTAASEGLLDVRSVVPDAIVDLRYATSANFVKQRLYPTNARCLVHRSMANGLRVAASRLRVTGNRLVFWDCYRPHSAQVRMYQVVPDANWVAKPTNYARSHESGRSVDVTLATRDGRRLDMGTGFDDFSARAHAYATAGVSASAVGNRARLRTAMQAGGLAPYSGEWWHFDGPGAGVDRPLLRAAVN
ncbi:putative D-alanyl-D-alanine dipeptidase [Gordonia effusa NBRC 100432]|uniref:D-alanyl-D-alanine dipeptidase n=1 Tax=Gordonia effusa NBRC 100432 TaxID=1077974 RepID=H0QYZ7_9ACTN|nr:M15 family metallopeptidase [Gordonia effusa]GAB18048.1 putative D-alanyl-D-alanine dipeptidase [Gordonia effusa NBRC 100432]